MKRFIYQILLIVGLGAIAGSLFVGVASASGKNEFVQGTNNKSIYKTGATVTVTGTVNGDIFCAGQTIDINAVVNGDVLCAGQTIDITGTVNGSVRLAGQTVNLNGKITRGASVIGQDIFVASSGVIGQDASLAGQTITVNGNVTRDLTSAASTLLINGTIGRDVSAKVNQLSLGSSAVIHRNVTYTSPNTLQKSSGTTVSGTITYHNYTVHHAPGHAFVFIKIAWLVAMTVFGVVLVALFPRPFRRWNPAGNSAFWWRVLTGFIAMIAFPITILILLLTIIGLPLGILLTLFWLFACMLSVPLAAYFTGSLLGQKLHPIVVVLIGSIILGLLELIPYIGWVVAVLAFWLGTGIFLTGLKQNYSFLKLRDK